MIIAGVIALCIVILILAFLFPKLSRHPQHGSQKVIGLGGRGASKAPRTARPLVQQAVPDLQQGRRQERRRRPQGPREDAVLMPGAGFEPARP
jgi:hypothetical protein